MLVLNGFVAHHSRQLDTANCHPSPPELLIYCIRYPIQLVWIFGAAHTKSEISSPSLPFLHNNRKPSFGDGLDSSSTTEMT